jgi:hypothetical protein
MQKITKPIDQIYKFVKDLLSRPSVFDGKWLVTFSLLAYFALLWVANLKLMPYYKFWKKLGVPATRPSFLDLRGVLSGFECTRLGYDVLLENPCDPWERGIIYPRFWWKFTWLGLDQSHTFLLAILLVLLFYATTFFLIGKLNVFEGVIYTLILCSPSVMFVIEKGNIDLFIYFLHFISLIMVQSRKLWLRILGYIWLIIPILLKILSFFSFTIILKEKKNTFIFWFSSLIMISLLYIYSIKDEIFVSQKGLQLRIKYSFNYQILLSKINSVLNIENIFGNKFNLIWAFLLIISIIVLMIITIKVLLGIFNDINKLPNWSDDLKYSADGNFYKSLFLDSFRMGSCFYLGTFIVTVSWDYKLIFLIFTVPQIIAWTKQNNQLSLPSSFALLGIVATLYLSSFQYKWLLDEVINWSIWFYFIYAFVLTLPKWIKTPLHNLISAKAKT